MKTLIAKKVGMTQIFDEESNAKGVTVLDISGCRVVQVKSTEKDGYSAAQLTIGSTKKVNRPTQRHYDKYKVEPGECHGFTGVMIRHNFSGQNASHGVHKVHRAGGSIGNASYPGHVFKGQKMAGRMGNEKKTIQSVTIVEINAEKNYILVNGPVPGKKGNIVQIQSAVKVS